MTCRYAGYPHRLVLGSSTLEADTDRECALVALRFCAGVTLTGDDNDEPLRVVYFGDATPGDAVGMHPEASTATRWLDRRLGGSDKEPGGLRVFDSTRR